jgi:hypothetical protein
VDSEGRTIWIVDAHRDGKRFVVRADEKLTGFVELESMIRPLLREFPYYAFCRASDRRWETTAKIDRIKWIGGGNADVFKKSFHLPDTGEVRENANCKHTVGSVGFPAFGIDRRVNVLHKALVKIDTRPLARSIRSLSCSEPFKFRIFPVVIGCHNLDTK